MGNLKNRIGDRYGMLLVVDRSENDKDGHAKWLCKCDCGNFKSVHSASLRSGRSRSCGCQVGERASERMTKHGYAKIKELDPHGAVAKTYYVWQTMRERCSRKKCATYKYYGAKGVKVCKRWDNFGLFIEDMGVKPDSLTIDRIDPYGDYEPDNCRWATWTEQANNKRKKAV